MSRAGLFALGLVVVFLCVFSFGCRVFVFCTRAFGCLVMLVTKVTYCMSNGMLKSADSLISFMCNMLSAKTNFFLEENYINRLIHI